MVISSRFHHQRDNEAVTSAYETMHSKQGNTASWTGYRGKCGIPRQRVEVLHGSVGIRRESGELMGAMGHLLHQADSFAVRLQTTGTLGGLTKKPTVSELLEETNFLRTSFSEVSCLSDNFQVELFDPETRSKSLENSSSTGNPKLFCSRSRGHLISAENIGVLLEPSASSVTAP